MDFKAAAYNAFFKRNSLWFGAIIATAVVIEGTSSSFMDSLWHNLNKGKLWIDVKERLDRQKADE